jgi:hypothetical protein
MFKELEGQFTKARALISLKMVSEGGGKFGRRNVVGGRICHWNILVWGDQGIVKDVLVKLGKRVQW